MGRRSLDGGPDADGLYGETGNDTYLFGRGGGQDRAEDWDATEGNVDVIQVGADVAPGEVSVRRVADDLAPGMAGSEELLGVNAHVPQRCLLRGARALSAPVPAARPRQAGMRRGRGRRGAQSRVQCAQFSVHASEVPA